MLTTDKVFAWHQTRKTLGLWQVKFFKQRAINGEDITRILFQDVVLSKSSEAALKNLLKLPGLKRYVSSLATDREKHDFVSHMRRYINIWLPECSFEISFTNRYMIDQWEARTTARKYIKSGEKIKYLAGNLVSIPLDEEEDEQFISNAFSITYSSRKKTKSLFLGPARFSNHDCDANAKLESRGAEGMVVIALRDIAEGDEITVNYGDNYFGEDNCECLCASCEKMVTGGWRQNGEGNRGLSTPRAGSEAGDDPGSRRSKRKRQRINYSQKIRGTGHQDINDDGVAAKRRKVNDDGLYNILFPGSEGQKQNSSTATSAKISGQSTRQESKVMDPRNASIWAQIGATQPLGKGISLRPLLRRPRLLSVSSDGRRSSTPFRPTSVQSRGSSRMTGNSSQGGSINSRMLFAFLKREPFSVAEDRKPSLLSLASDVVPSIESDEPKSLSSSNVGDGNSLFDQNDRQSGSPLTEPSGSDTRAQGSESKLRKFEDLENERLAPVLSHKLIGAHPSPPTTPEAAKDSASPHPTLRFSEDGNLSELPSLPSRSPTHPALGDAAYSVVIDNVVHQEINKETPVPKAGSAAPTNADSDSESEHRYPGDYIRTERLLGPRNARWVECRTCDDLFVQQDGHQTRRECPRCERHSKLYGFQWPQTDYERGGPERVMDHRTVNRFLSHTEEMAEPKRRARKGH